MQRLSRITAPVCILALGATAQYTPIEYNPATMSADAESWYDPCPPEKVMDTRPDEAGLDAQGGHTANRDQHMWLAEGISNPFPGTWFRADLGDEFVLGALKIWNFNEGGQLHRGVKDADVYVAFAGDPAVTGNPPDFNDPAWTKVLEITGLPAASGEHGYMGEPMAAFRPARAQWVGLDIKATHEDYWFDSYYVGLSKIQFYTCQEIIVSLDALAVSPDLSLAFDTTLQFMNPSDTARVTACHGATDNGGNFSAWNTDDCGLQNETPFPWQVTGLATNTGYFFAVAATNAGHTGWSETQTFITGVVEVRANDFYKTSTGTLTFRRPASTVNVPLTVSYTLGGDAVEGAHYAKPLGSVTFPVGGAEVTQAVQGLNAPGGDIGLTITLTGGNFLHDPALSSASCLILDNESGGDILTWNGSQGSDWDNAFNWTPNQIPGPTDTAVFGNLTASNAVISLNANQAVYKLVLDAGAPFTIGDGAPGTLTLTFLERAANAAGTHAFAAPVNVVASGIFGHAPWDVNGEDRILFSAPISTLHAPIIKDGDGAIAIESSCPGLVDLFTCREGVLLLNANEIIHGNLRVGGGDNPARAESGGGTTFSIADYGTVTVATNGHFIGHADAQLWWSSLHNVSVEDNGRADFWMLDWVDLNFKGGEIHGGVFYRIQNINSQAHHQTAVLDGSLGLGPIYWQMAMNIEKGGAPVALDILGNVSGGSPSQPFYMGGGGVVRLSGDNTFHYSGLYFENGTILFDNPAGTSGSGATPVIASYNGVVGGAGFIGADVTLANVWENQRPALAPGTMDNETGEHLIGTLTVGTALTNNAVAFWDGTRFLATLGSDRTNDCLNVYGGVTIGADTTLELTVPPDVKDGVYTLVNASNGITGHFAHIVFIGEGNPKYLRHTDTQILYDIPLRRTLFLLR